MYIFGTLPEKAPNNKLYNTGICIDKNGDIIGKHPKTHLFDIDIPGQITYKESDTF